MAVAPLALEIMPAAPALPLAPALALTWELALALALTLMLPLPPRVLGEELLAIAPVPPPMNSKARE